MEMIGEKMTNLLIDQSKKPEPEVNPLLVQVVLQIFMVKFCVSKIQSWYPGDPAVGEFLTAIYSEIRSTEEQAVSGRWRALTRAHTRPSTEAWPKELFNKLFSVLMIAAWRASSQETEHSFQHRLPPIFKAVNELRMAMGENFTSADLDISVFDCDTPYDPSFMDDAYGDGRQPSGKRGPEAIVGTTGMGLKKLMAKRSSKDALQFQNVISAKIVLKLTLNEALEPVQPSAFRRLTRKKKPVENTDGADLAERHGSSRPKTGESMDTT